MNVETLQPLTARIAFGPEEPEESSLDKLSVEDLLTELHGAADVEACQNAVANELLRPRPLPRWTSLEYLALLAQVVEPPQKLVVQLCGGGVPELQLQKEARTSCVTAVLQSGPYPLNHSSQT